METHVVLFPLPVIGHITPMLHLGAALASHGLVVTFIATERSYASVLRAISETCPEASSFRFLIIPDDMPQGTESIGLDTIWENIVRMFILQNEFEKVIREIVDSGHHVACLISDCVMEWTQPIAAKFEIPRAAFWTSSIVFLLCLTHSHDLLAEGYIPLTEETADRIIPHFPGIPKLRVKELPYSLHVEHPSDPGFNISMDSLGKNLKSPWFIINALEDLEPDAAKVIRKITGHAVLCGPLLPLKPTQNQTGERPPVLDWLDRQKRLSVLYVSFGTVAGLKSVKELEELAYGVEESGQPFVWVYRSNLVEKRGEANEFMNKFQERTSKRGLVIEWAPQLQVLQHEAIGGFLTHCGWNSVMESVWSGVPMLGWPCHMAEQNLNLKFVSDVWKIGFGFEQMERGEVSSKIFKLIQSNDGKEARTRAIELGGVGRKSVGPGGKSDGDLHSFVQSLRTKVV